MMDSKSEAVAGREAALLISRGYRGEGSMGMYNRFIAFEHYRMQVIELWPDGPAKEVALNAVRSALASLLRLGPPEAVPFECIACRRNTSPAAGVSSSRPLIVGFPPGVAA